MPRVSLSPEAVISFRRLPLPIKSEFDRLIRDLQGRERLRLPGAFPTHQLEGAKDLWTLKVGPYRGVYRWDGAEVRFIRFGHVSQVYFRLPK